MRDKDNSSKPAIGILFQVGVAGEPGAVLQHRGQPKLGMGSDALLLVSGKSALNPQHVFFLPSWNAKAGCGIVISGKLA